MLAFEAPFLHTMVDPPCFSLLEKVSQKALVMYFVLLQCISKREMSQLTIVQGEISTPLIVSRSCACHSPRTVLATASIFAMLVLYQLLLKCTKCQYGELTVSMLFSAQENTRHAHRASVSRNLNWTVWLDMLGFRLHNSYSAQCVLSEHVCMQLAEFSQGISTFGAIFSYHPRAHF